MPSIWFWNAFLMAFFACMMCGRESQVTRSTYATPSKVETISAMRTG